MLFRMLTRMNNDVRPGSMTTIFSYATFVVYVQTNFKLFDKPIESNNVYHICCVMNFKQYPVTIVILICKSSTTPNIIISFKEKSHSCVDKQTKGVKYPITFMSSVTFYLGCYCLCLASPK